MILVLSAMLWNAAIYGAAEPHFDRAFSEDRKRTITDDLAYVRNYRFDVAPNSAFARVFGGTDGNAVRRYLDERVRHLIPAEVIGERVWGYPWFASPAEVKDENGRVIARLAAENVSANLWMIQMRELGEATIRLSTSWLGSIAITSMRVGVISIGPRYFERRDPAKPAPGAGEAESFVATTRLERLATLIHEARHSDCTGGLSFADVENLRYRRPTKNKACGHEHTACPAGHLYAGAYACESEWGGAAVAAVFLDAVAGQCSNCAPAEREDAARLAAQTWEHVLNRDELLSGKAGPPDMTSQDLLTNR